MIQNNMIDSAISKMRAPSNMHIICIDITNKCDLACSNCTRLLENQDKHWEMSLDNFRIACKSLVNYKGTIAIIGGNPVMHSKFNEICQIFRDVIKDKKQRGIWTNNTFKHEKVILDTFGGFNLNAHNVPRGIKSLRSLFKKNGRRGNIYDGNSHHSPLLAAGKDLFEPAEMWERISKCDINQNWSATIVENNGKLAAYFCEVAASFDLARNENNGIEVVVDWWKKPMNDFKHQITNFCPSCGVPARLKGSLDCEETDQYTSSNSYIAEKARLKGRKIILISKEQALNHIDHEVTEYTQSHLMRKKIIGKIKHFINRYFV